MTTSFIPQFEFIGLNDTGPESGARCPHCGAEGRYIYVWKENGIQRAAMAGCYAALTGHIKKDDITSFLQRLAIKQAKNKSLTGWDKTVIRMQKYINDNQSDDGKVSWADKKIREAVADAKSYQFGRR